MFLRYIVLSVLGVAILSATANATTFYIDQFQVTRDGNPTWFVDNFDDGVPPPSSNGVFPSGTVGSYLVLPDPFPGVEAGGKVALDTAQGEAQLSNVTGDPILFQRARLATNTSNEEVDLSRGLKDIHAFEVRGLFDLIEPTVDGERYGVRLVDFGVASPNDNVQLSVDRSLTGEWRVNFREADFGLGVFNTLDSYSLTGVAGIGDYEQIALMLTKGDAASKLISASFELIDLDGLLGSVAVSMSGNASLFDGERWTRAAFFAGVPREVAIPVPPTLLLMIFGLMGLHRRSRR